MNPVSNSVGYIIQLTENHLFPPYTQGHACSFVTTTYLQTDFAVATFL